MSGRKSPRAQPEASYMDIQGDPRSLRNSVGQTAQLLDQELGHLSQQVNELDTEIETETRIYRNAKEELKGKYKDKIQGLRSQRLLYEKRMDTIIRSQYKKEQREFNSAVNSILKTAISTTTYFKQLNAKQEKKIQEEVEASKQLLLKVSSVGDSLADYSINMTEEELDWELQSFVEELNSLESYTPWYLNR